MPADAWSKYEEDRKPPAPLVPLVLRAAKMRDPVTIPPRQWLYGTQLVRGFVTVLVAPGGTGKTAYAMVMAAALASGISLLGEHIFERINVAVLNLEDPMDELDRRLAAIRIHYNLGSDELADRYFIHAGEDRPITMAALDEHGFNVVYPDEDALIDEIQAHQIGLIVVDPFAESHTLEENSNPQMIKAAAAWRRVARATSCSVLLVHHVRKGAVADIDSARGAKALTDSARIGLLLSPMSEEEAAGLQVDITERNNFVRLDDAKANMAPRATKARWFKHHRVELNNGQGNYPNGDRVSVIEAWNAPTPFTDLNIIEINSALDFITNGPEPGVLFTATKRGGSHRWVGRILVDKFDRSDKQASAVVATWLKSGLLFETDYSHPTWRRPAVGVRVNETKRPTGSVAEP